MLFFVYKSILGGEALTIDWSGANLPSDLGPWGFVKDLDFDEGVEPPAGLPVEEALKLLDEDGYYLVPPMIEIEAGDANS